MKKINIIATNKKAKHNYHIEETYECGIVLVGTEVKSLRKNQCTMADTFATIENYDVTVYNIHIAKYKEGNIFNHEERRNRKLLLNKREIQKINSKMKQQGYTLIPIKIYFKNNLVKLELGLGKGKSNYDKRSDLKEFDNKMRIQKSLNNYK